MVRLRAVRTGVHPLRIFWCWISWGVATLLPFGEVNCDLVRAVMNDGSPKVAIYGPESRLSTSFSVAAAVICVSLGPQNRI
ncbi:MAG: hypothetical protein LAP61_25665 [Acidobacteriia bacterium]|nr:hypothetical protein [Terriglobia bacterium]